MTPARKYNSYLLGLGFSILILPLSACAGGGAAYEPIVPNRGGSRRGLRRRRRGIRNADTTQKYCHALHVRTWPPRTWVTTRK